jgi:hypothetical protein
MHIPATRNFYIGLDLGQRRNFTALAVIEKHFQPFWGDQWITARRNEKGVTRFMVRALERIRLATPYPDIVDYVETVLNSADLLPHPKILIVDGTGVGAPVVDLLRRAKLGCTMIPVTITGSTTSQSATYNHGYQSIPKSLLLTSLQVTLQQGLLEISQSCAQTAILEKELIHLRMQGPTYGQHDDLALALSLANWQAKPCP